MTRSFTSRAIATATEATLTTTTAASALIGAYLAVLTVAGARRIPLSQPAGTCSTRFAILVPAHDEELVIADALQSFHDLDYDHDRFAVHVVADNCTDRTADVVRANGWTVHERHAPESPGKGPALNWLFDRLDIDGAFDVAIVVDADSIVAPGFLHALDRAFLAGAQVAQGHYGVREPSESTSAAMRFAALACRHHVRALGRCRLGASAGLYGNGMAFRRDVLRRHRWTGHLVEDAELQMELLLGDATRVVYVPSARLEAEMPGSFEAATSQNARWEAGRVDVAKRYVPALARRALRPQSGRRVAYVDAIADHLVPPLSVVVLLQTCTLVADTVGVVTGSRPARIRFVIDALAGGCVIAHVLSSLWSVRAPRAVYSSLTRVPGALAWKTRVWLKALSPAADVSWERTRRNAEE